MHYAKYGKMSVGSILTHSDRGINSADTHTHSNECIDASRTHLNYDLKDRGGQTAYQYYKKRIDKVAEEIKERTGKGIRKDAVVLCSWAVTVPKDLPTDKQTDFFQACYDWFSARYGDDNIVTAAVHLDETTPHLHLQFTPIIEQDGVRRLCAKDIETKKTLRTAHQELEKHLKQALGCEVNLLNGATSQGNRSILELKTDTLKEQLTNLAEEHEMTAQALKDILDKKARAAEIHKLFGKRTEVTYDKSMLESTRAIGDEAYNDLKQALELNKKVSAERKELAKKAKDINPLYDEASQAYIRANEEKNKQIRLTANLEKEIEERAEQRFTALKQQMFEGVPSKREQRLAEFCDSIQFPDGTSVLDAFEEQEKQLKKRGEHIR